MSMLQDSFGRRFPYIRMSITDVCNFKCGYCLPNGYQADKSDNRTFLNIKEIERLTKALSELGVCKIRLTGGEPTVRKDFFDVLKVIKKHSGIKKTVITTNGYHLDQKAQKIKESGLDGINISIDSLDRETFKNITGHDRLPEILEGIKKTVITTNGYHLDQKAQKIKESGLDGINISIDSLDRETFKSITGHDRLPEILEGIKKLQELNFKNIKINAVLLKGVNDKEENFDKWAEFIKTNEIDFRYIELMQTGDNLDYFNKYHVPSSKFVNYLNERNWIFQTFGKDAGPSKNYINTNYKGKFGVIAPYSKDFCKSCNRLRITAKGDLRLCLFGNTGINIRHLMQKDDQIEELKDLILKQLNFKKESHYLELGETGLTKNLSTTGG